MKKKDIIQTIIGIFVIAGFILGAITYVAKAADLELVAQRLDQKITSDRIKDTQRMIYELEAKYKGKPCSQWTDERDRKWYQELLLQLEEAKKEWTQQKK